MRYMGSKRRIAKELGAVIERYRKPRQVYVEPFVGGGNMLAQVKNPRIAADINPYAVAVLAHISRPGWAPFPPVTREQYARMKQDPLQYPEPFVGFAGFSLSFGGKFLDGIAVSEGRDIYRESITELQKQGPLLDGTFFHAGSNPYHEIEYPADCLIYCDPPYQNTTGYKTGTFDHDAFFQWAEQMADKGHTVLCSEYDIPRPRWSCVWVREITTALHHTNGHSVRIERLYRAVSQREQNTKNTLLKTIYNSH